MPSQSLIAILAAIVPVTGLPAQTEPAELGSQERSTVVAPDEDRDAILAMAGAFSVTFHFEETAAIATGYALEEPYMAEATELVRVIADEGDFISLQHVLVVESGGADPVIVKHWRQDWRFEDSDVLAFKGHATWQHEERATADIRGTWTQAVFQTTDSPRYEAVGRWTHIGNQSSWESELTWRPLPRRERRRRDYDVIVCRNRHTITPTGWVHEQANQKVTLTEAGAARGVVAHEIGINTYNRVDPQEVAAADSYWAEHSPAWAEVRAAWTPILERQRFSIRRRADGMRLSSVIDQAVEDASVRDALPQQLAAFVSD